MPGTRADDARYAERINAAADLLEGGMSAAQAAAVLADRYGVSTRQARRYADRAALAGRREVPEESVVFTVKLPASVAARVRERAQVSGVAISAVVAQALTEFLSRGDRRDRRG